MAEKRDYYEVLGIPKTATEAEIKKAFRTTAKKYHPDMHPGDKECEEKFKEAQEAYAVLSDPEKRRQYDQFGHAAFDGGAGGAGGFDFSGMDMGDIFGDISETFSVAEDETVTITDRRKAQVYVLPSVLRLKKLCLDVLRNLSSRIKKNVRPVTELGQNRELHRKPAASAGEKGKWYIPSSLCLA